jgi:hypothetical protein
MEIQRPRPGHRMKISRRAVDDRFILRARASPHREARLSLLKRHSFVNDLNQCFDALTKSGFCIPSENYRFPLLFGHDHTSFFKLIKLALDREGVSSILVGGAVLSIYNGGSDRAGDLNMITDDLGRSLSPVALAKIGFTSGKSRYDSHPKCAHLGLEFPKVPVELEQQFPMIPAEISAGTRRIK